MQKITLYRSVRANGGVTTSPKKPDGAHTTLYRLVADEGKTLTDGSRTAECVDTDAPEAWTEIPAVPEELTVEAKAEAFDAIAEIYEEGDNGT